MEKQKKQGRIKLLKQYCSRYSNIYTFQKYKILPENPILQYRRPTLISKTKAQQIQLTKSKTLKKKSQHSYITSLIGKVTGKIQRHPNQSYQHLQKRVEEGLIEKKLKNNKQIKLSIHQILVTQKCIGKRKENYSRCASAFQSSFRQKKNKKFIKLRNEKSINNSLKKNYFLQFCFTGWDVKLQESGLYD